MMLARERRMSKRRLMAKSKIYGFSPWVDQVDAIDQIMKDTGERTESAVLRKLVDEALDARRKKRQSDPLTEKSDDAGVRLEKIESLLMRIVRLGDVSFRIQDVCLALLQAILAQVYATRRLLWESLVVPQLRAKGIDENDLERQFALAEARAKNYAYGEAERIKQSQETEYEIVRPSKNLTSAANAVGSNAVQRQRETADRCQPNSISNGSKVPRILSTRCHISRHSKNSTASL
jgi:hypothetical protein